MTNLIYAPGCSYFQLYTLIWKKESLPDKAYFYFAFASNMSKIASGTESLRAEHRGNDPRNWPLCFQCPCRHIRHDLYMIHKQSVDKEQSKSTRGHRTSEKKKLQSLFSFSNSEQHGHPYIFISFLQGAPERRCSFFLLDLR